MDETKHCPVGRARYSSHSQQIDKSVGARKSASNGGATVALNCNELQASAYPARITALESSNFDFEKDLSPLRARSDSLRESLNKQMQNIKIKHKEIKNRKYKNENKNKYADRKLARRIFDSDPVGERYLSTKLADMFDRENFPDGIFSDSNIHEYRPLFLGWQGYLLDTNLELQSKGLPLLSARVFVKPVDYKLVKYRPGKDVKQSRFIERVFSNFENLSVCEDVKKDCVVSMTSIKRAQRALHNALDKSERLRKQMAKHARRAQNIVDVLNTELEYESNITTEGYIDETIRRVKGLGSRCSSRYHDRRLCICYYDVPEIINLDEILDFVQPGSDSTGADYIDRLKAQAKVTFTNAKEILSRVWEKIKVFFFQAKDIFVAFLQSVRISLEHDFDHFLDGWHESDFNKGMAMASAVILFIALCRRDVHLYSNAVFGIFWGLTGKFPWENFTYFNMLLWTCALLQYLFPPNRRWLEANGYTKTKAMRAVLRERGFKIGPEEDYHIVTEGYISDLMQEWVTSLSGVLDSTLISSIKNVLQKLLALKVFPKEYTRKLIDLVGTPQRATVAEVLLDITTVVIQVVRSLELWSNGFPLVASLLSSDPVGKYVESSYELLAYKDFLYSGLPVEHKMCRTEFCTKLKEGIKFADTYLKSTPRSHVSFERVKTLRLQMLKAQLTVENQMRAGQRIVPYSVVIVGLPGTGKSRLVQHIACANAAVRGRSFVPGEIFTKNPGTEYYDGVDMLSTSTYVFPELGNSSAKIASAALDPSFVEILSICDNCEYPLNMAFEDKGKVFANPQLVIVHTNNETLNAGHQVMNKAAYYRRFLFIRARVDEKFKKENSCMIDINKSLSAGGAAMDRFRYNVYHLEPIDNVRSREITHLENADIYDLTAFLERDMERHIAQQEAILRTTADPGDYEQYRLHTLDPITEGSMIMSCGKTILSNITSTFEYFMCGSLDFTFGFIGSIIFTLLLKKARNIRDKLWLKYLSYIVYVSIFKVISSFLGGVSWISCFWTIMLLKALEVPSIMRVLLYAYDYGVSPEKLLKRFTAKRELLADPSSEVTVSQFDALFLSPKVMSIVEYGEAILVGLSAYVLIQRGLTALFGSSEEDLEEVDWNGRKLFVPRGKKIVGVRAIVTDNDDPNLSDEEEIVAESDLRTHEELMGCGRSYHRVPRRNAGVWNVQQTVPIAANTLDLPDMANLVARNVRACMFQVGDQMQIAKVLGLKGSWILVNRHLVGDDRVNECELHVSKTCDWIESEIHVRSKPIPGTITNISPDLVIFQIGGVVFRDITPHFIPSYAKFTTSVEAMFGFDKVNARYLDQQIIIKDQVDPGKKYIHSGLWTYPSEEGKGKCGWPLIIKHGRGCSIVGIHSGGDGLNGFSQFVSGDKLVFNRSNNHLDVYSEGINIEVDDPSPKSLFRFENMSKPVYYGKEPGCVLINNKSRLQRLFPEEEILELFEDFADFKPDKRFVKPLMKPTIRDGEYISPWNVACRQMDRDIPSPNYAVLDSVIEQLSKHIVDGLIANGVEKLAPLLCEVAVNGTMDDPFIRRINSSTAGGHGWPGPKSDYLVIDDGITDWVTRQPTPELKRAIEEIFESYERKEMSCPIFQASLKDEPRPIDKVISGKTRVFYGSPTHYLVAARMLLAPILSLMGEHSDVFCTGIGINMHSEAGDIASKLFVGGFRPVDGDIRSFDIALPFWVREACNKILYNIAESLGYSDYALDMLLGILSDALYPTISMLKDIFVLSGLQPSGIFGTAEMNSLALLVAIFYLWKINARTKYLDFFSHLKIITYGDDLLMSISDEVIESFNNEVLCDLFMRHMGVEYTAGDKGTTMTKYNTVEGVTFLKRKFVKRDGEWIAPLDLHSCFKMLEWYIPSSSCPINSQVLSTVTSNLIEMYFHLPRERHDGYRSKLISIIQNNYQVVETDTYDLPTWSSIYERLHSEYVPLSIGVWEEDVGQHQERQSATDLPGPSIVAQGTTLLHPKQGAESHLCLKKLY